MAYIRLGDLLTSAGVVNEEQIQEALKKQKGTGRRLGQTLIDEGYLSEQQLIQALEVQLGVDFIDLTTAKISGEALNTVSKSMARRHSVIPVELQGNDLYLAMSDPLDFVALEEVRAATRKHVIPMISTHSATTRAISTYYGTEGARRAMADLRSEMIASGDVVINSGNTQVSLLGNENESSAPAIRLVNSIIERAISEEASDIHIEPRETQVYVRMRMDGVLHVALTVPKDMQAAVTARIKIMTSMDVTERRIPQDGRAAVRLKGKDIDLRCSTLPTVFGEKIVIRLLEKSSSLSSPESLGMFPEDIRKYNKLISNSQGVILIAGPTGSGKSSTMFTMISQLNTEQVNLVTLEDPVEYNIDGANQVPINPDVGMTFASGLRSILRQDPDIISVGEIRDGETAAIAMRAAVTGHVVLSTIHTNDSLATLDRLADIGVEPYMTAAALKGIISQRLVRRICPNCKYEYTPTPEELQDIGMDPKESAGAVFYKSDGCSQCYGTGYKGRMAVFEILVITGDIRRVLHAGGKHNELADALKKGDFSSLLDNCRRLVLNGSTTVSEAMRVAASSD